MSKLSHYTLDEWAIHDKINQIFLGTSFLLSLPHDNQLHQNYFFHMSFQYFPPQKKPILLAVKLAGEVSMPILSSSRRSHLAFLRVGSAACGNSELKVRHKYGAKRVFKLMIRADFSLCCVFSSPLEVGGRDWTQRPASEFVQSGVCARQYTGQRNRGKAASEDEENSMFYFWRRDVAKLACNLFWLIVWKYSILFLFFHATFSCFPVTSFLYRLAPERKTPSDFDTTFGQFFCKMRHAFLWEVVVRTSQPANPWAAAAAAAAGPPLCLLLLTCNSVWLPLWDFISDFCTRWPVFAGLTRCQHAPWGGGKGGEGTVLSPNVDPESGLFSSTASSLPGHRVGKTELLLNPSTVKLHVPGSQWSPNLWECGHLCIRSRLLSR